MTTNDEIMKEHKMHTCNPKSKKGESQLYDEDCVIEMLDEARADAIAKRDAEILEGIQKKKKIRIDLTEYNNKLTTNTAKRIFKELDAICSNTGTGLGLDLEDAISNHARDSSATLKKIQALKKQFKVD